MNNEPERTNNFKKQETEYRDHTGTEYRLREDRASRDGRRYIPGQLIYSKSFLQIYGIWIWSIFWIFIRCQQRIVGCCLILIVASDKIVGSIGV
jgi:hypothetical protein